MCKGVDMLNAKVLARQSPVKVQAVEDLEGKQEVQDVQVQGGQRR